MKYLIVTNTINRTVDLVVRSIRNSLKQKNKPQKVILIDQNSPPLNLPDDVASNPILEIQKVDFKSVSAARNSLRTPPDTEWIFFCDDDGYPCENYSQILSELINSNPKLEILAGSIIREDTGECYSARHKLHGSMKKFRYTKNLMGSNFVIKASTFRKLKGFDENFGAGSYWGSSEETDFCWKAFFSKIPMEFFPELKVFHLPPFNESIKTGFKKAFDYGVGKGALVFKWLIKKKKLIVLYEFGEMLTVPIIQTLKGLIFLKPQLMITNFATITGRLYGFAKAIFVRR
jgi:GT2 family glycosyltransferase